MRAGYVGRMSAGIGGVGSFTPLTLANLSAWYDSSRTPVGAVSSWTDYSGNANTATEGTAANQPINTANIQNSKSALLFDGSNDKLSAASATSIDNIFATGGTMVFVLKVTGAGGGGNGRIVDKTNFNLLTQTNSGALRIIFNQITNGTSGQWRLTNDSTFNSTHILIITYDASSVATAPVFYIDSATAAGTTVNTAPTGTATSDAGSALVIGNRTAADRAYSGYTMETVAIKRVITAAERANLLRYLSNKWGITVS